MSNTPPIHTLVITSKPTEDNMVAILLLWLFGEKYYPGIRKAKIGFRQKLPEGKTTDDLEQEGFLIIDLKGSKFRKKDNNVAIHIANHLGVQNNPTLEKLLTLTKRSCLEKEESTYFDSTDQAFSLSALIKDLNQEYFDNPRKVIDIVIPILLAHYREEKKRVSASFPKKEEELKKENIINNFEVFQGRKLIRVMTVKTKKPLATDFFRTNLNIKVDLVIQPLSSGHINIITKPEREVNLHDTVIIIRVMEARKKNAVLEINALEELAKPNILKGVEEWNYDPTSNSLQNGGIQLNKTPPTKLDLSEIEEIIKAGLNPNILSEFCPKDKCLEENCDFYDYHLERCLPYQK